MKKSFFSFLVLFILFTNAYAYKDMSKVNRRATDLHMRTKDYTFAMAISGAMSGSLFGLFLWKIRG